MIKDGIKAIKWFTDNGIRTNCTLIFSAGQAMLAAKAGAAYVSPFIGRIDDSGWDGMILIEQIANIFPCRAIKPRSLAASIRNANHIVRAAELGAMYVPVPLESILGLLKHPLTDLGLAKFLEDAKKMQVERNALDLLGLCLQTSTCDQRNVKKLSHAGGLFKVHK
jgi:transaldolase